MKATVKPGRTVTQSVDGVCKLYNMYATPIQRTSSETMHGEESWILSFAGILCWERGHVDEGVSSTLDGSKITAKNG